LQTVEIDLAPWRSRIREARLVKLNGLVTQVIGLTVEVQGLNSHIGEVCEIALPGGEKPVLAEVVGFREDCTLLMPLGDLRGIYPGCKVTPTGKPFSVKVGEQLLGRVLNGLGEPMDGLGPLEGQLKEYPVDNNPPNPMTRRRISEILSTGVRVIDSLLTCGQGQRIGIFAGSGVGKSTLLGMISRFSNADINVIALVGERGREVLDFIEKDLGPSGLARSVVVVATSEQPALVRLKGGFCSQCYCGIFSRSGPGRNVNDGFRYPFCHGSTEVGLAIGEPPATKGYTPSVFALLPKLLERPGMAATGSITAFFTVLVDGDDLNEPIADAVRGILDGHIVLSRSLAAANTYPAVDALNSVSRLMTEIVDDEHRACAGKLRDLLATYTQAEDLINIGAYVPGSNHRIDEAIAAYPGIMEFLKQDLNEQSEYEKTLKELKAVVNKGVNSNS
jgi:flagellum-specific ATP synthase